MRDLPAMLPPIYGAAEVQSVTPLCATRGRLGVVLTTAGGTHRVALTATAAKTLANLLLTYACGGNAVQSSGSSLIPSVDGSVPSEGQKV